MDYIIVISALLYIFTGTAILITIFDDNGIHCARKVITIFLFWPVLAIWCLVTLIVSTFEGLYYCIKDIFEQWRQ